MTSPSRPQQTLSQGSKNLWSWPLNPGRDQTFQGGVEERDDARVVELDTRVLWSAEPRSSKNIAIIELRHPLHPLGMAGWFELLRVLDRRDKTQCHIRCQNGGRNVVLFLQLRVPGHHSRPGSGPSRSQIIISLSPSQPENRNHTYTPVWPLKSVSETVSRPH